MGNTQQKLELNLANNNLQNSEQVVNDSGRSEAFTCEICIEPVSSSAKKIKSNASCMHPFCTDCLAKYIQAKLDDSVAIIKCPALHCEQLLDPFFCRLIISAELFSKWCDCLCESSVLPLKRSYCPYQDCSALIINECGGSVRKSTCPNCKKLFCYTCEVPWHAGYWCTESRQMRDANDIMFGELVEKFNWTRCPRCGQAVERGDGCKTILCRCGTSFCHECGKIHYGPCAQQQSFCSRCFVPLFFIVIFATLFYSFI
ncbi:E3 ubiquitin-protein ligase RSL1-like [Apium graveolens]|uniref:E3 ubiquitin-protein ligase RSL1-like n=1 Tax=Apium graveolens TaxID=4045 RepID=UPI003D792DA1